MMTIQHRKNKRGLQQLSDVQKMEAITKVQKGETKAAVAREFGVPESTLRGWCKKAKLNGHCHSVTNKSLQVTSTISPVLRTPEMAYRDCSYSKESGSDEGSTNHPFSDEQEEEDIERDAKSAIVIPEEQRRVLDWIRYGHYSQLMGQTPSLPNGSIKPAQPVTSSTCDDIVNSVHKVPKIHKNHTPQTVRAFGFYNWYKTKTSCEEYSSPISPISRISSDKNNSYEDEPLALIVPSKRRFSDVEASLKNQLNKMYHIHQSSQNENINNINNNHQNPNTISNSAVNAIINNNNISTTTIENNDSKQGLSVEEALQHGEVFLDWLKACSDPNVTVFQAVQISTLIRNIRSTLEKNQK